MNAIFFVSARIKVQWREVLTFGSYGVGPAGVMELVLLELCSWSYWSYRVGLTGVGPTHSNDEAILLSIHGVTQDWPQCSTVLYLLF